MNGIFLAVVIGAPLAIIAIVVGGIVNVATSKGRPRRRGSSGSYDAGVGGATGGFVGGSSDSGSDSHHDGGSSCSSSSCSSSSCSSGSSCGGGGCGGGN